MTDDISVEESKTLDLIKQKAKVTNLENNNSESKSESDDAITFKKLVGHITIVFLYYCKLNQDYAQ
jgi:hypothetical protein